MQIDPGREYSPEVGNSRGARNEKMEPTKRTKAPIKKTSTTATKARLKSINNRIAASKTRMNMIYSTAALLLLSCALGANASLFSFSFTSSSSSSSSSGDGGSAQATTSTTTTTTTTTTPEPQAAAGLAVNSNSSSLGGSNLEQQQDLSAAQSVGDLVAIGAISLLDSAQTQSQLQPQPPAFQSPVENQKNKLDYIIDFMRANKLTKFCDLITSQEAPVRQLSQQLNDMPTFTLFVPTNEALLLMASGQLEQIRRQPEILRQFLGAHATDELVVPRTTMSGQRPASLFSLSGGHLRVVTVSQQQQQQTAAGFHGSSSTNGTKLELIVNGANVLSGNSYALQEPNNNKVTYAIVHLIDRVLYPMPTGRLVDKVRALAPRMASYFELAAGGDRQLRDALTGGQDQQQQQRLWTLLVPGDHAFEAKAAVKLNEQLETNRTFLLEFLRGHLIDGLYFSSQLALAASSGQRQPVKLMSLSGRLLEVDAKTVQARTLVLINSTPLLEPDMMALNGVVHLISRPILERHLADDCDCATNQTTQSGNRVWPERLIKPAAAAAAAAPSSGVVTYEFDNRAGSNWARRPAAPKQTESSIQYATDNFSGSNNLAAGASAELEREESSKQLITSPGERIRSQRSGNLLVERNNQDFYRPSTAPVNLLAPVDQERPAAIVLGGAQLSGRETVGVGSVISSPARKDQQTMLSDAGEASGVEKYKIVLNATTRQRLREAQQNQTAAPSRFAYDRPLGSSTPAYVELSPVAADSAQPTPSSFLLRRPYTPKLAPQQQQPLDRIVLQPMIVQNQTTSQDQLASSSISRQQQTIIKFQPEDARDSAGAESGSLRLTGKTSPPPPSSTGVKSNLNNCAFYDTDCRRLLGKLVRLPPVRSRNQQQQQQEDSKQIKSSPASILQASSSNTTFARISPIIRSSSSPVSEHHLEHLDSTFGETTTDNAINNGSQFTISRQNNNQLQQNLRPVVISPVRVSPLVQPLPPWTPNDKELDQRVNQWRGPASVGSKLDTADLARLKGPAYGFTSGISRDPASPTIIAGDSKQTTARAEILLLPVKIVREQPASKGNFTQPSFIERPQQQQQQQQQFASNNNRQFHTPTPYSVSLMTTHMPTIFSSQQQPNRQLGRLTNFTALEFEPDGVVETPTEQQQQQQPNKQLRFQQQQQAALKSPSALRRQKVQQQAVRKVVQQQQDDFPTSDVSVTSAGAASLLATQASNVSTNFVRSVALPPPTTTTTTSGDFFQDRTIAEIMDDSGLRIDGQQVTFARLKECLQEAKLLNLLSQGDNSLTIFMPTDMAFQRLVQQQALLQQQQRESIRQSGAAFMSAAPAQSQTLPLMVRAGRAAGSRLASSEPALGSARLETSMASVGDRLTLDCNSQQVRKLLLDHLSTRLVQPKQLTVDTAISSLNGHQLLLSSVPSKKIVVVDGQPVIAATRAKNGMVYVVNKFLNLTQQLPNVLDLMESQSNLTTFLSYLNFSSMADRLKRETGPLTILAPTNEAFEQLTPAARQLINSEPAALADILRGHIVEGAQFGKLIPMRSQLKTMNSDQSIEAKVIKPNVYLLDNQMTSMRLIGTTGNGVVNAIDRLIVPAWLKVSMGGGGAKPQSGIGAIQSDTLPGTRVRHQAAPQSANLNLPTISNQPVQFEQPRNRFSAPGGRGDTFFFDSSRSSSTVDNSLNPDATFEPTASSEQGRQSPFTRLPDSELTTSVNSTTRLSSGSSKNMQLIEKLAELMQAKKFVKYLLRSGVSDKLKADMNYVILVPTDQAIEKLPKQIIDLLERDKDRLADLINYHVLDTTFEYINTIPDGQTLNTLNEKDILFNWHRNNTILTASGAVVMGGIQEENIALLIVDRVLYPTPGDLLNIISKSPILSNFTSLVRNAGLERQLSLAGPFTLFAPSDFAFNQLSRSDLELLRRNKDTARRFLLRHLSQPAIFTSSIALSNSTAVARQQAGGGGGGQVPQMQVSNLLGEELTLRQRNDYFSVNEVNFSYADVAATNGVVHVIDGLL